MDRLRRTALIAAFGSLGALAAPLAAAERFVAKGSCREGEAHGAYELKHGDGTVRVVGAFNRGKRTGSFIYWNAAGERVAHLPFEEDMLSGTVALWYATSVRNNATQQKLEAAYTQGRRNGVSRSWYPDGRPRAEFAYSDGELVEAKAWSVRGSALTKTEARALAERDADVDAVHYRSLEMLVRSHLPRCEAPAPLQKRASSRATLRGVQVSG